MSNITNNIKTLIQSELSELFNHIVNVSENAEDFVLTKESLVKISNDYFLFTLFTLFTEASTKKGKVVKQPKEKKEIPEEERCISIKKDGSRCNGRKTKKEEHKNTEYEELCSLHINMALKESAKLKVVVRENEAKIFYIEDASIDVDDEELEAASIDFSKYKFNSIKKGDVMQFNKDRAYVLLNKTLTYFNYFKTKP